MLRNMCSEVFQESNAVQYMCSEVFQESNAVQYICSELVQEDVSQHVRDIKVK